MALLLPLKDDLRGPDAYSRFSAIFLQGRQLLRLPHCFRSFHVAEWLAFPTLDHKARSSNPAGCGIQLMTMVLHCTEPFMIPLPLSQYNLTLALLNKLSCPAHF